MGKLWKTNIKSLFGSSANSAPTPIAFVGRNGRLLSKEPSSHSSVDNGWEALRSHVTQIVAEVMVRVGFLSAKYKAWVVPAGGDTRRPLVLIRMDRSIAQHAKIQLEFENELAALAQKRYDIVIEDVIWLDNGNNRVKPRLENKGSISIDYILEQPNDPDAPTQLQSESRLGSP